MIIFTYVCIYVYIYNIHKYIIYIYAYVDINLYPHWYWFFLVTAIVQLLSCVPFFETTRTITRQVPLSSTISQSLLKFMFTESVMISNHLILCCHLLLLPSIFPNIRVFSNESVLCLRWPKNWSFSISPSNEYSRFISFRIDWFDLLVVQGTLKSLLSTTVWKINSSVLSLLYGPTLKSVHESVPSGSLHKPLILICQRADRRRKNYNAMASRMQTTITEN